MCQGHWHTWCLPTGISYLGFKVFASFPNSIWHLAQTWVRTLDKTNKLSLGKSSNCSMDKGMRACHASQSLFRFWEAWTALWTRLWQLSHVFSGCGLPHVNCRTSKGSGLLIHRYDFELEYLPWQSIVSLENVWLTVDAYFTDQSESKEDIDLGKLCWCLSKVKASRSLRD